MGAPILSLRDDFEDNLTASAWIATATGSATVAETGGQSRFTLPSSTAGTHIARYTSRAGYDLTGASFFVNVNTMVATGVAATAFFQLYLSATNTLQWIQLSGTLYARTIIGGVSVDRYTVAWSAATYKYLRISESAGTITWWSSTNGTSWTSRATLANPFAVTDLFVDFGATCGNVASPGSFRLDDVNLVLPALTTTWHWTEIEWPLLNRFRNITIAATSGQGYIATYSAKDASGAPVTPTYWAGPQGSGMTLTEQASQAAAQAMAVNLPIDGRWDLPTHVECRFIRLYHRSITGSSYTIREYYARRLTQADDMEAELFRGLRFEGHQFIADKLSALTANIGQLIIDPDGYLWQGTGTAASPGTGLKIFEVGGVGKLETYNAGVVQVTLDTDGILKAGAGNVLLDAAGITLLDISTLTLKRTSGGAVRGYIGVNTIEEVQIVADQGFRIRQSLAAGNMMTLDVSGTMGVLGGLNIGTALGATAAGQLATSGVLAVNGATLNTNNAIAAKGAGATNATAAVNITNSGGLVNFQALDDGTIRTRTGNRWDLRGFVTGALSATGHVDVLVDGTLRRLLVG